MRSFRSGPKLFAALAVFLFTTTAPAEEPPSLDRLEREQRELREEVERLRREVEERRERGADTEELRRRQGVLADEIRKLREALVLPERRELKSAYGLGPAASKVYGIERGLSIAGYGEANFRKLVSERRGKDDVFDFLRFVLYVGYKYRDWLVFNSEIEFEHATTESTVSAGDGSVSLEFASVDFLLDPRANLRAGLLLVPVGFLNEVHEPPFFHGNNRPPVETELIPTTWRANGFGLFGELLPGLEYRAYGVTSLNAKGFSPENLRGGRQRGNRELANDFSGVGRLDYTIVPGVQVGGSVYLGNQGQDREFDGRKPGVFLEMYEAHAQVRTHGLELRGLGVYVDIDDARALSAEAGKTIGEVLLGGYAEVAYDVMPHLLPDTEQYLAPWFRYSWIDTQNDVPEGFERDRSQRRQFVEFGISYKPIPEFVAKIDARFGFRRDGALEDSVNFGAGYVF
ncbi:MAG: hypothetical protein KatS3mg076_2262 [Candidatus Binatia bacterium]|nr:MAG: hypothetical protein KatS3mg076_2262 [Candidatus Binatia bacterium]